MHTTTTNETHRGPERCAVAGRPCTERAAEIRREAEACGSGATGARIEALIDDMARAMVEADGITEADLLALGFALRDVTDHGPAAAALARARATRLAGGVA